ncbi:BBP7 family outer membrane beta-barrel protein [Urbifossiella limnaea]|uniref:Porin n=1 Tax=Urbifossiella limnaea TaxID=2528023 RepID=A0A517XPY0_9BACT|nr:BBP7 family outer membrane beta-barrel protein [Urbifossiella limnaea]QDU19554.1 hypothetical protein ETAA1_14830 [Urbifossiella limnaea]
MRRVLLGGLGLAFGVFGRPALAQDSNPAASPNPVQRAARLGRPSVAGAPVGDPGITPASAVLIPRQAPAPIGAPAIPAPMPGPMGAAPKTSGPPSITMSRDQLPTAGLGAAANPVVIGQGTPFIVGQGAPVVVGPEGVVPGDCGPMGCPTPVMDAPLTAGGPAFPALGRLFGLGCDRTWVSGEYLMWWTKSTQLPPLAATGIVDPSGNGGILAQQNLLAGSFGETLHGGARFGIGHWFTDEQRRGVDARFFFLFKNGSTFTANSVQYPTLFLPFNNVNTPVGPTGNVVAAPGIAAGGIAVTLENSLWGAEVNYRRFLFGNACARVDGLAGFRYMNFTETLTINETAALLPTAPFTGAPGTITDRFRADNNFYGGQFGMTGEVRRGRWFVDGRATVALGTVQQTAEINGGQSRLLPNGTVGQYAGGLYAQPGANIGTYTQNKFAVMPEAGINLGYHITPGWRVFVGYNVLYLSSVLRPANVIDTNIDAARIPNFAVPGNPAPLPYPRPQPQLTTTDFFAQGINFGMQWTW